MNRLPSIATSQRGGSTLMGLIAGILLGMLMIIKWPSLAYYLTPYLERVQIDGASLLDDAHSSGILSADAEYLPQNQKATTNAFASAAPIAADSAEAVPLQAEAAANPPPDSSNHLPPKPDEGSRKTAVWSAFSSEAAARRFADFARAAIDAEVLVSEAGPAQYVPEVTCADQRDCQSIRVAIHDFFNAPAIGGDHD
jgi:hypothetical protein